MGMAIEADGVVVMDEPVRFRVTGCPPGARVTVTAATDLGDRFVARAVFGAGDDGVVDPARHPSLDGSYTGIDPFGLWWSGQPEPAPGSPATTGTPPLEGRVHTAVLAEVAGGGEGDHAAAEIDRRWYAPGVAVTDVAGDGFKGRLFVPPGAGPFPGVVCFGGSAGGEGVAGTWAPVLASRGFAVLSMAYFALPGLPEALLGIDVEVVARAVDDLRAHAPVSPGPVALMGQSRGSELALLAAGALPGIGAVVVFAPSGVAWSGFGARGPIDEPAWRVGGRPFPFAGTGMRPPAPPTPGEPVRLTPLFMEAMGDEATLRTAEIPVERIDAPILAVSGTADAMWPSTILTERAERRAEAAGLAQRFVHLRYPDAGHLAGGVPGMPFTVTTRHSVEGGFYDLGGSLAGNAAARADSWPRVVEFLRGSLA